MRGADSMTTITPTNLRANIFETLNNTAKYNQVITILNKEGNVVMMSEDDYRGLMETLYLNSQPRVADEILQGAKEPISECVPADEVEW